MQGAFPRERAWPFLYPAASESGAAFSFAPMRRSESRGEKLANLGQEENQPPPLPKENA